MAQGAVNLVPPPPVVARSNFAADAVFTVLDETGSLAQTTQATALAAITALGQFNFNLAPLTVPNIPVQTVTAQPLGTAPTAPGNLTGSYPSAPADPAIGGAVSVDIGAEPVFDVAQPSLLDIPIPDPLSAVIPASPSLTDVAIPVDPGYVLPSVPTMLSLNIPGVPVLDIPLFTDTLASEPAAPSATFAWSESQYNTSLLTLMNTRLLDLCGGSSTGLDPLVEAAIWQRNRDRTQKLTERAVAEAARMVAGRGFSMPQGTLVRLVQQALADGMAKDAEDSRTVMIEQAKLEQDNFRFAFTTAVTLEGNLIQHFDQVQARALDATKFAFRAVIDIFNARVTLFNAQVQAFGVKAQVFETRLKAALAQIEIYKATLEGQQLIGQLNEQQVRIYAAQLEGVRTVVDVYKARIEGARAQIEAQHAKVDIFKAQVDAFDSQVRAKTAEYQGYGERVKAELTKVQAFGEEVRAYSSRVDAFAALVKARLGVADLQFKTTQEMPLEVFKSRVQAYATGVAAVSDQIKAQAQVYATEVQAYAAGEQAKATFTSAQVEAVKATTAVYTSQAQLAVQSGEANLRAAISAAETAQASLRAAGQLSGQLASAALAARNVSASISDSVSNSASNSTSNAVSRNKSDSDNYSDVHTHQE